MCGSAVKSAEPSVVGRLFHSALVRRQMLLAECWKPTEVSKQLLFIVMLWHLHLSLLFEGWSLLLTFYLDQIDVSLLTFCSVANILILCSAQFWLGCGGWVALDPFDFSISSQTSFSLPCLGGWRATWLVDPYENFQTPDLCLCCFTPDSNNLSRTKRNINDRYGLQTFG